MAGMIGVIGGSGLYRIEGLEDAAWMTVETPWGAPSDQILTGRLSGVEMAFLPRHGRGHRLSPSTVNYRANIDALKRLGVTQLVAVSAVGSLREELAPGDFVLVDQYIDRTHAREGSFFGTGLVAHVSLAHPTCARLGALVAQAAGAAGMAEGGSAGMSGARLHRGATYLAMEGPQFSTLAESRLFQSWGADVIGMTGMPEARLAREAELCYASLAMVTDYDCWHPGHEAVDVAAVIATLGANAELARAVIAALPGLLPDEGGASPCPCGCTRALQHAVITAPESRDPALVARLAAVAGRVL